jgi:hypothetical protein
LDGNKNSSTFMKQQYFLKMWYAVQINFFINKAYRSPNFCSTGMGSLLEDDPLFLAISICSLCWALTSFPNIVNIFLLSVLYFMVFLTETWFNLWIHICRRTMFHQHSRFKVFSVCVPHQTPLPAVVWCTSDREGCWWSAVLLQGS